jgi:hypothetical protein
MDVDKAVASRSSTMDFTNACIGECYARSVIIYASLWSGYARALTLLHVHDDAIDACSEEMLRRITSYFTIKIPMIMTLKITHSLSEDFLPIPRDRPWLVAAENVRPGTSKSDTMARASLVV